MKAAPTQMKAFYRTCLVVTCAFLLSACGVNFINPLPASLFVKRDVRVLGRWIGRDGEGESPETILFADGANGETLVSFEGGDPNSVFIVKTLKIDDSSYMTLIPANSDKWRGYLLVKYVVAGDRMTAWTVDEKRVRQAIGEGKLKGTVGNASYEGSTVTDTPRNILGYLKTAGPDAFKLLAEFERIADK